MANLKVTLTSDMLKLIRNIRFTDFPTVRDDEQFPKWSIDLNSIYGGAFLLEDISYILGRYDEHIPDTEENPMGPEFEKDFEDYMFSIHHYIMENLPYIEDIIHQFGCDGGVTEGTYKAKDYERIWTRV